VGHPVGAAQRRGEGGGRDVEGGTRMIKRRVVRMRGHRRQGQRDEREQERGAEAHQGIMGRALSQRTSGYGLIDATGSNDGRANVMDSGRPAS